ncbi:MAG: UDP-N-acetyl-D-mannosamine dehydrogenase [Chloroflexi bacterium GWB2_49_20]|nr:MAG: UDP-N-acetyl-D-mannosamine dehydrogenase [Chloroflexi bacterium GWB2_49_20]OGN79603.1 MAG: UDP-N-acetyl-D-mannosamine dehydrogenase [Chloroflexi bacterium GWC2_49_37]OGN84474.1 MAG: UDP-N-acetyl-D-mannosamine dehydrogenase [Chloroflexi bacterium GWD2_49_16]HBG74104.1 UDP-N-acetyl-D-mannosamine dehydrogenase [Anaerolineae bacterium]HCC78906.1 UDP-N-acetyl-D-mannosamine dehydrogenase [Anaerolineae bacterium]
MNFEKICVLGLGYIGLPTASTFATHGLRVVGVDVNLQILETLRNGGLHIHEPGLRTVVEAAIRSGNLSVSDKPEEADAFIIAVPTPFYSDKYGEFNGKQYKLADMRAVTSAAQAIAPVLRKGNLVVLESTSPPRTTNSLVAPILEESGLKAGIDFHLAYSPERVLPGQILRELIENARVIGGITLQAAQAGRDLYATFVKGEIILTDATTAEMVKLMENTYRDINIAIANEFSRLSDQFGVDVWEAISIANRHPRVKILNPGPGVGGHCISVDPWFFVESAPEIARLIYTARQVNDAQPKFVLELVAKALGDLKGKKIAVLGLAYKPDVDDLRESPAVEIVHLLQNAGAFVKAYEPFKSNANLPGISIEPDLKNALSDVDGIILLVNHKNLCALSPQELASMTSTRILIDTVNGWSGKDWEAAGFSFYKLGANK